MSEQVQNLRRLIDSGKRENIEMAIQLSTNWKPESKWLHDYAIALMELPPSYKSWQQLYLEVMRYGHEKVQIPCIEFAPFSHASIPNFQGEIRTSKMLVITMDEIRANVANEFTYLMTSLNRTEFTLGVQEMERNGFSIGIIALYDSPFRKFMRALQKIAVSLNP